MPHNPILSHQKLSRTDFGFQVPLHATGALYQGKRFIRLLKAGEGPSATERLTPGGLEVFVIDTSPHELTWRVSLPTRGDKNLFAATIALKYQVSDVERMVKDKVSDTEAMLTRFLEPNLRRVGRIWELYQHSQADTALEEAIRDFDLHGKCGLQLLDPPAVVIHLSEEDLRNIRNLRAPQVAEHAEGIQSKEEAYDFQVSVSVTYQVTDPDKMPSDSVEESEKLLWPRVRRALQRTAQTYRLSEVSKADDAMQNALEQMVYANQLNHFGLVVSDVQVNTRIDGIARKRYQELAEEEHKTAMESARFKGAELFAELIQKGSWAVLAVAASKGEISTDELYSRLSEQERERLQMQIDLLKTLRQDNMKDEAQDYEISKILIDEIAQTVTSAPGKAQSGPGLASGKETPRLEQGSEVQKDQAE